MVRGSGGGAVDAARSGRPALTKRRTVVIETRVRSTPREARMSARDRWAHHRWAVSVGAGRIANCHGNGAALMRGQLPVEGGVEGLLEAIVGERESSHHGVR